VTQQVTPRKPKLVSSRPSPREHLTCFRAATLGLAIALGACAPTSSGKPTASDVVDGRAGCSPPSPVVKFEKLPEIRATTDGALSAFGLLMVTRSLKMRSGDEIKIVWRVTGEGDLSVGFSDPLGNPRPLVFGPERHGGSSYNRPGEEWGTGFTFDRSGCWHIALSRGSGTADVWLKID
jgi:hypothetical protein